jgi:hypothetical protein
VILSVEAGHSPAIDRVIKPRRRHFRELVVQEYAS